VTSGRAEELLRRINEARLWQGAQAVGAGIAKLPPDDGLSIMRMIYARINDAEKKRQVLKPFVFGPHPHALHILDLAARSESPAVRDWALTYAGRFAYRGFEEDGAAYETWRRAPDDMALDGVVNRGVRSFLRRLQGLPPGEALEALR